MKWTSWLLAPTAVILLSATAATPVRADDRDDTNQANRYEVTKLTSNISGQAENTDPVLQNAWGVAFTPGASPFWIADNATGCSTLYDGAGVPQPVAQPLQVKIPLPGNNVPMTACKPVNPNHPPSPTRRLAWCGIRVRHSSCPVRGPLFFLMIRRPPR